MSVEIIPTNTCPQDIGELSRRTEFFASFAPVVQLDISDGLFSPVTSWPYSGGQQEELLAMQQKGLPHKEKISYEIHLMVQEAREIGIQLAQGGASRVIGHIESFADTDAAHGALDAWRQNGAIEAGLALLMHTPLEVLDPLVAASDVVQLMTIPRIGAQGAPFAEGAIERVEELHARYPKTLIEVDGGISDANIAALARAGARRFGVGSAISKASDPKAAYERLKGLAESAAL
jgi:ribulose-phosphate 3-epimerase